MLAGVLTSLLPLVTVGDVLGCVAPNCEAPKPKGVNALEVGTARQLCSFTQAPLTQPHGRGSPPPKTRNHMLQIFSVVAHAHAIR